MIEKAVVAAVLYNSAGELLLQLRDDKPDLRYPNFWTLFGGSVEDGETPEEAIHRELMEEMEIVLLLTFWKTFVCPVRSIENIVTTYNHVFVGKLNRDLATIDLNEGQAMRYFSPDETTDMQLAFDQHLILNEWINTYD